MVIGWNIKCTAPDKEVFLIVPRYYIHIIVLSGPKVIKLFFMVSSAEHEISNAH